jgi:hypothetical protein
MVSEARDRQPVHVEGSSMTGEREQSSERRRNGRGMHGAQRFVLRGIYTDGSQIAKQNYHKSSNSLEWMLLCRISPGAGRSDHLVRPFGQTIWSDRLVRPFGQTVWSDHPVKTTRLGRFVRPFCQADRYSGGGRRFAPEGSLRHIPRREYSQENRQNDERQNEERQRHE